MQVAKKEVNMLSGPIMKGLLAISLPIMVMNVLQTLFNMADMTILQMFDEGDGYSVGAVGVCGTPTSLITGILIGIASGANVVIARYIGSRDKEKLSRAIGTSIVFSVLGGLFLALIGQFLSEEILSLVNCPPELLPQANLYFRIYFAGAPILMLYNFSAAILRAAGDTKRPMIYIIIGGVANVVFNCIFVGIFDLSVAGVAIATVISWIISATLCIITLTKDDCSVRIERAHLHIYSNELKEILYIGIPTGLQSSFYSIANMMISGSVNTFGPDATTGVSIANQFDAMTYHVVMAPSYALMPYVSQNLGSRNVKRAKKAVARGVLLALIMGAVFGWLIVIFSRPLASIMTDSPSVIAFAREKMLIVSATYFIHGINEALAASLRGMRRPIIPTISTFLFSCVFRVLWVAFLFPLVNSVSFLYLVWPVSWLLSTLLQLPFCIVGLKKESIRAEEPEKVEA